MQRTFKNGELYDLQEAIMALSKLDVPAKTGYRIAKLVRMLSSEINDTEQARRKLILKYGEKREGEDTIGILPNSENWPAFFNELNELMAEEVNLDYEKVILPGDTKVSINILMVMDEFIEVSED